MRGCFSPRGVVPNRSLGSSKIGVDITSREGRRFISMAKKAKKAAGKKSGRKPNAAFMKPMQPSPILAEIVGDKPIPRTEVVKKMWQYIKKNGCQDKRNINADDKLKALFGGKKTVDMFEMMRLVNKNLS
jgi:upstream activation factor subunit UAF30